MNNLSILPYICLHALQIQNIKRDVVKKVSPTGKELNKNEVIIPVDKEELSNTNEISNNVEENIVIPNQSTNIDELPQPALSNNNNIGSEL